MKLFFACLVVSFLLICIGCTESTHPSDDAPPGIVGLWNWIESDGGGWGHLTPKSEGYTKTYRFDPDSLFFLFQNDTLVMRARYKVSLELNCHTFLPIDTCTVLILGEGRRSSSWAISFPSRDSLLLTGLALDMGFSKFVRKK